MTIRFHMTADHVREVCMSHAWYTKGTAKAYSEMLDKADGYLDVDEVVELAHDIVLHSDVENTVGDPEQDIAVQCVAEILIIGCYPQITRD